MTQEEIQGLLETPDLFRSWLKGSLDESVGLAQSCSSCPIAMWLGQVLGGPVEVYGTHFFVYLERPTYIPLPDWVSNFVCEVDGNVSFLNEVYGIDALDLLNGGVNG